MPRHMPNPRIEIIPVADRHGTCRHFLAPGFGACPVGRVRSRPRSSPSESLRRNQAQPRRAGLTETCRFCFSLTMAPVPGGLRPCTARCAAIMRAPSARSPVAPCRLLHNLGSLRPSTAAGTLLACHRCREESCSGDHARQAVLRRDTVHDESFGWTGTCGGMARRGCQCERNGAAATSARTLLEACVNHFGPGTRRFESFNPRFFLVKL
jgi:hypothetical protein